MNTIFKSTKGNFLFLLAFAGFMATGSLFVSAPALAAGPAPVNLLSASNFVILSQTGVTDTGSHSSVVTGNIGASPITAAAMNGVFCSEVTGKIYGVDAAYTGSGVTTCFAGNPPLANKTLVDNAVLDIATAYTDAAGRTIPTSTELGAGNIGGMTLAPGLYKWSTDVSIPTNVTLSGGPNDVWIFQIGGNLNIASGGSVPAGIKVILAGGAKASNIFWQVGGVTGATLGTYSTFNGNILSAKQVIIQTGAVLNGRALAQTQVTLDANSISVPHPLAGTSTFFTLTVTKSGTGTGVVTSNPQQGISCGDVCVQTYASGTIVTLTVVPDSGSNFSDTWSGAGCSGSGSCVVTINGNTIVYAHLSLNTLLSGTTGTISGTVFSGSQVGGTISGGSVGSSISGTVTGGGGGGGGGGFGGGGGTGVSTGGGGGSSGSINSDPNGLVLGASTPAADSIFPIGGVRAGEPVSPWNSNYSLIILSIILLSAFIVYAIIKLSSLN